MERLTLDEMRILMDGGDLRKERQEEIRELARHNSKDIVDKVYDELPVEAISYVYAIMLGMNELYPEEDQETFDKEIVKAFKNGLKKLGNIVISEDAKLYVLDIVQKIMDYDKILEELRKE